MTIPAPVSVHNGKLMVHGRPVLTKVPSNIVVTQDAQSGCPGVFIGATAAEANSLHVFSLGVLKGFRFICCFRFRLWWMTHAMGDCGRDIPSETQFLLLESRRVTSDGTYDSDGNCLDPDGHNDVEYIVFLPLLDGPFRASLQGSDNDEMHLCLESGDPVVQARGGLHSIFVHVGSDPFQVVGDAVRAVEEHLQSFRHREKKKLPPILDWFGWCTWDAFYTDVTAEGVMEGLQSLCTGGAPPRFLIIDDGWQSITSAEEEADGKLTSGTQFARRLSGIKENHKFKNGLVNMAHDEIESAALGRTAISGLKRLIQEAKQRYNLKFVYMWHAITGYWGGVKPGLAGMEHYESTMTYPVHSPGVLLNQPDIALDSATVNGLGLPHPQKVFNFYDELHSYLANAGIDGVKVDGQSILESVAAGHGGRVKLTKEYQLALEASIARNFPDNGIIACMSHHNDGIYSTKHTAVVRASDDFWPRDPASHTIHIASVAYNSLFLGEFMQPDWDMFHSLHPAAEYHAAARAVGGCGIYVSDTPGQHDFNLLKKLVFHDGSVLRARLPGRPTKDCLFADPARDGRSLLKIWNMNEHTGVVGAFNCQGAGWCKVDKANKIHDETPKEVTGTVQAEDVPYLQCVAPKDWGGDVVTYCHRTGSIVFLGGSATLHVTLKVLEYEIFTFSPVKVLSPGVSFAPIGLLNMMNSGGAVKSLDYQVENGVATVKMILRGHGRFGAFSSKKPRSCTINSCPVSFDYRIDIGLVSFDLGWPMEDLPVVHVEL